MNLGKNLTLVQALKAIAKLEPDQRKAFIDRLERVRHEARNWGWGVCDAMDDLIGDYASE